MCQKCQKGVSEHQAEVDRLWAEYEAQKEPLHQEYLAKVQASFDKQKEIIKANHPSQK